MFMCFAWELLDVNGFVCVEIDRLRDNLMR